MADIGMVAIKRQETLRRVLEALEMDLLIPPTKVIPLVTEAFYLEILEQLATRVIALERGRAASDKSIDALAEAVAVLLNRRGEAEEAKSDDK